MTWFLLRDRASGPFQSGLYFRGTDGIGSNAPKTALTAFRFPLVAFQESKTNSVMFWGRVASERCRGDRRVTGARTRPVALRVRPNRPANFSGHFPSTTRAGVVAARADRSGATRRFRSHSSSHPTGPAASGAPARSGGSRTARLRAARSSRATGPDHHDHRKGGLCSNRVSSSRVRARARGKSLVGAARAACTYWLPIGKPASRRRGGPNVDGVAAVGRRGILDAGRPRRKHDQTSGRVASGRHVVVLTDREAARTLDRVLAMFDHDLTS